MFRGIHKNKWLYSMALLSMLHYNSLQAANEKKSSKVEKIQAPTMDDYSDFVAKKDPIVSDEALRKADELRLQTLSSIQKLLDSEKISKFRKFELLLRLGETYAERHDYLRKVEIDSFAKKFDEWKASGSKGQAPIIDHKNSTNELTKAANSFRTLVSQFGDHPRADAALFSLGQTLTRLNNDNAPMYFKQLIEKHPKSQLIPDTYLALGEFYFERHKIEDAIANYKKVLSFKTHRVYPYAVYKLGWSHFNAGGNAKENYKKAIAAFKLVIKTSDTPEFSKSTVTLRQEAINDLVVVWAESEDVDSAWSYFKQIGEENNFYKMLERLGYIYAESGREKEALQVFTRLLKESPLRENNPNIYVSVMELYDLTGNHKLVVETGKSMISLYLGQTEWTKKFANQKDKSELIAKSQEQIRVAIHKFGTLYHDLGQKKKSDDFLHSAVGLYSLYLQGFAKTEPAYEIRYYLAELLYDFKQFEAATDHFIIVSQQKITDAKYQQSSAINAVTAMHTLVSNTKFEALPPKGSANKEIPIPMIKTKLIKSIDNFVSLFPKDSKGHPMRFSAAEIYFEHGHYKQAMERFAAITQEIPGTKQSDSSVKIILAYNSDKKDWESVVNWSKKFLTVNGLLNTEMREYVQTSLRVSLFKYGLALESSGEREKAAEIFMGFQKEFPKDESADKALYNATVNYYKLAKIEEAIAASKLLLEHYPQSKLKPDVIASVAQTYDSLADFDKAAEYYSMLAIQFPNDSRSKDALFNAGMLYKGLGKLEDSEKTFKKYLQLYSHQGDIGEVLVELADILEKNKKFAEATKLYDDFGKKNVKNQETSMMAQAKSLTMQLQQSPNEKTIKELESIALKLSKMETPHFDTRRVVASALFSYYEKSVHEFKSVKLDDGSRIENLVAKKNQILVNLADKYELIMAIGNGEFVVASLYRLGEMHELFANELFNATPPAGSNQATINQFKSQLEKVAFPLRDEAYKFYETALNKSKEVDAFTEWTKRTHEKMVALQPQKHKVIEAEYVKPSYMSHRIYINEESSKLAE